MRNDRVAVLDVRSFELTFLIGTKGFNSSLVVCGEHTEEYEGYSAQGFLDEAAFEEAVRAAVDPVLKTYKGKLKKIYVGTPSPFLRLRTVGQNLPFSKRHKVSAADIETLYDCGLNALAEEGRHVHHSAMYFAIGNTNNYYSEEELYGTPSASLRGGLCYYFADENYCAAVERALKAFGFTEIVFMPTMLAEAVYLLPKKERAGYAVLLDVGYLTATVSVVYGNGTVHEKSFTGGVAEIIFYLTKRFGVEPDVAESILACANIAVGDDRKEQPWTNDEGVSIPVAQINDVIEYGVDQLCDHVNRFLDERYKDKDVVMPNNTLWITGEGVGAIMGIADHMSRRLDRSVKILSPDLAYNDMPSQSSRLSLLSMAISNQQKKSPYRLFGGKRR
jgi:cell division ATPase FtsA